MRSRLSNDMVNMAKRVRGASTEKEYRKIAQDYGYEFKDGMSKQDMISAARDSMRDSIKRGPSMGDRFRAYHGPAITGVATAGLAMGTAFRVMGPKSNRELYSEPGRY
nr:MAG TPA: HeH/LEM domain [Caudoviricetes sp.]